MITKIQLKKSLLWFRNNLTKLQINTHNIVAVQYKWKVNMILLLPMCYIKIHLQSHCWQTDYIKIFRKTQRICYLRITGVMSTCSTAVLEVKLTIRSLTLCVRKETTISAFMIRQSSSWTPVNSESDSTRILVQMDMKMECNLMWL